MPIDTRGRRGRGGSERPHLARGRRAVGNWGGAHLHPSSGPGLHLPSKNPVDLDLIAIVLPSEPVQDVGIDPDADRLVPHLVTSASVAPVPGGRRRNVRRIGSAVERMELRFLLRCQRETRRGGRYAAPPWPRRSRFFWRNSSRSSSPRA